MSIDGQFVLFADVLGFAEAIERERYTDIGALHSVRQARRHMRDELKDEPGIPEAYFHIDDFHWHLEHSIRDGLSDTYHSLITFSDSAFVASEDGVALCAFAGNLMRDLLRDRIPVRMGVGCGSFIELMFGSTSLIGGHRHTSQFFGSGVVRAYWAESRGGKGCRILVHPSAAESLARADCHLMALPHGETGEFATHELNYLYSFGRGMVGREEISGREIPRQILALEKAAPEKAAHQYRATWAALERMRSEYNFK